MLLSAQGGLWAAPFLASLNKWAPGLGACWPFWPAQESVPSSFYIVAQLFWPTAVRAFGIPQCSPSRFRAFWPLALAWPGLPDFAPLGLRSKTCSNGLPHNRTKVSGSWAEIDGVHINFSRSIFLFMTKNTRVAESGDLDFGSCSIFQTPFLLDFEAPGVDIFKTPIFCWNLKNGTRTFFQNLKFP